MIFLRKIVKEDMDIIFQWSNDSEVRKWSFSKDPISYEDHKAWFKKKMIDKNSLIWILIHNNKPSGLVRLERKSFSAVINYLIAPHARGQNLGSKMLRLAIKESHNEWNGIDIIAYTIPQNIASNKSLIKAGFTLDELSKNKNKNLYFIKQTMDSKNEN
tara:strand:+ start:860 stop:1336 length:477 start_codon:yes stop_codon:yes gene_type:complete